MALPEGGRLSGRRRLRALPGGARADAATTTFSPDHGRQMAGQRPGLAVVRPGRRLVVHPPQFVPGSEERWAEAMRALRLLYRDFLEGGGLDELRRRWSPVQPAEDTRERKAA
jgi:hypothetical protein